MPAWLRIESFADATTLVAVALGAAILVCTSINLLRHEARTGAILIALLGFALVLSPKLKSFAFAGATIEFVEATNALTAKLTQNVETLTTSIADLSQQQAALAGQVQKLAETTPSSAAGRTLGPIIDQSKRLSETLEKARSGSLMELQSLQKDLGTAVQQIVR